MLAAATMQLQRYTFFFKQRNFVEHFSSNRLRHMMPLHRYTVTLLHLWFFIGAQKKNNYFILYILL